jgi:hypothetical protein
VEEAVFLPTGNVKPETRASPYSDTALGFIRMSVYVVGIDAHVTAKVFRS